MDNLLNKMDEFDKYVNEYNMDDPMIARKYFHSYRVMHLAGEIASDLNLSDEDTYLAMIIGLLHDYARFMQWTVYKTYSDDNSVDHGDLACNLLFDNNEIQKFNIDEKYYPIIYNAIKYHNKYSYPKEVDEKTSLFCKIIKDADKLDILYLISIGEIKVVDDDSEISNAITSDFYQEKLLRKEDRVTKNDLVIFYLAMIFDMNFSYSYKYIKNANLIEGIFETIKEKEKFKPYVEYVKKYMKEGKR